MEQNQVESRLGEISPAIFHKAVGHYYRELAEYTSLGNRELVLRPAFQHLLSELAPHVNLALMTEMTIRGGLRPDGALMNEFNLIRGCWEAKGPTFDLDAAVRQKIMNGYPLDNTLFENTKRAILFQQGERYDFDMTNEAEVVAVLQKFLTYQRPDVANLEQALREFQQYVSNTDILALSTSLSQIVRLAQNIPGDLSGLAIPLETLLSKKESPLWLPPSYGKITFSDPSAALLEKLRASQISLDDLHWRQLEKLVADLLSQDGYKVTLGPGIKDGGKDIIAVKPLPGAGSFMTVWQVRKLKPGNKITISAIRELADTRQEHKASKGVIVTTTSLTRDALKRVDRDEFLLGKVDRKDLLAWIGK